MRATYKFPEFHVLTSCVLFDHLVNSENGSDFVIAVLFVRTDCVLLSHNVSCPHKLCII